MRRKYRFTIYICLALAMFCGSGVIYARYTATHTEPKGVVSIGEDVKGNLLSALRSMPSNRELWLRDSLERAERLAEQREAERESRVLSIACVGDMVLGVNYPDDAPALPVHDGAHLFDDVKEYLQGADIAAGNLECLLLDKGGQHRYVRDQKYAFFFRSPERYINHFLDAGFDFLSIGNNHLRDFGEVGVSSTLSILEESGIAYAGLRERAEIDILERDGVRYGFAAFAPFEEMCDIHDYDLVRENIRKLREEHECDIVIVTHHGGAEGSNAYRVPREREWFGGGYRGDVYEFSHVCVDAGADLVFGHGPHVVRGMEIYKGKLIAYSLGNFCTPYKMNLGGRSGYAPILIAKLSINGEFRGGEIISATQRTRTGPKRDAERVAVKEIQRLSKLDFPESKLIIADDGTLSVAE